MRAGCYDRAWEDEDSLRLDVGAVQFPRMKRFCRWVFNGLAAVSPVLCIAMVALWIRSYLRWDMLVREEGNHQIVAHSHLGLVSINFDILDRPVGDGFYWRHESWDTDFARSLRSYLRDSGFRYGRVVQSSPYFPKAAPSVFYNLQVPTGSFLLY